MAASIRSKDLDLNVRTSSAPYGSFSPSARQSGPGLRWPRRPTRGSECGVQCQALLQGLLLPPEFKQLLASAQPFTSRQRVATADARRQALAWRHCAVDASHQRPATWPALALPLQALSGSPKAVVPAAPQHLLLSSPLLPWGAASCLGRPAAASPGCPRAHRMQGETALHLNCCLARSSCALGSTGAALPSHAALQAAQARPRGSRGRAAARAAAQQGRCPPRPPLSPTGRWTSLIGTRMH